jgi:hypothetical protein
VRQRLAQGGPAASAVLGTFPLGRQAVPDDIDQDALRQVQSPDDLTDETRPYFAPGDVAVVDEFATTSVLSDAPDDGDGHG